MKKCLPPCRLLALSAVLAAPAGGQAQGPLMLYGLADAYLQGVRGADSRLRVGSGGLAGSRLGLRAVELLRGDLRASFTIEAGLDLDEGRAGTGSGTFWTRQAHVGLLGPWGRVQLGRQYGSLYALSADFSAFYNGSTGASTALIGGFAGGYEPVRGASAAAGYSATGLGGPVRLNNSIRYHSPTVGGWRGGIGLGLGEAVGGSNAQRSLDLHLRYRVGWKDAMVALVDERIAGGAAVRTWGAGAAWTFGRLRALGGFLWVDDRSAADADGRGWWLGGDYRVAAHLWRLQFVQNRPAGAGDRRSEALGLGYQYELSRRTALYSSATHFRNGRSLGAAGRWHASVPPGLMRAGDNDVDELVVGMRHAF